MYLDSLEISATDHCNLSCAQCNHASPHLAKRFTEVASIERDLSALAEVLRAGELRIAGGEPLLHPELTELVGAVRRSGIAPRVVVISNGVLLHKAPLVFLSNIDELRISRYPGVSHRFDLQSLQALCDATGVSLDIRDMPSFTRTILTKENPRPALVKFIYRNCSLVREWSCHLAYEGYFYKCTTAAFMQSRLAKVGIDLDARRDAVNIHDNPDLHGELESYMVSSTPLASCAYCLGTVGARVESEQLSRSRLQNELVDDAIDPVAGMGLGGLVDSLVLSRLRRAVGYTAGTSARRRRLVRRVTGG